MDLKLDCETETLLPRISETHPPSEASSDGGTEDNFLINLNPFHESNNNIISKRGLSFVANIQAATNGFAAGFHHFNESREAIKLSVIILVLYTVACAIGFAYWDQWSFIDAMYFVVVSFTTCGYGDLFPQDDIQRLCICIFILFGVGVVGGYTLSIVSDTIINAYTKRVKKENKNSNATLIDQLRLLSRNQDSGDGQIPEEEESLSDDIKEALLDLAPFHLIILLSSLYIGHVEGWSIIKSIYFCVVTSTSVGYGDVTPETPSMRLFAVFFIPVSIGLTATTFARLTSIVLEHKASDSEKEFLNRKMTEADFILMDVNQSGTVDYEEFITFMLIAMGKVDHEDMIDLKSAFNNLSMGRDNVRLQDLRNQVRQSLMTSDIRPEESNL